MSYFLSNQAMNRVKMLLIFTLFNSLIGYASNKSSLNPPLENLKNDPHAAHKASVKKLGYKIKKVNYQIPNLTLINSLGEEVDFLKLVNSDQPIVLNFIFTTCTTICPVMTATFSNMNNKLGKESAKIKLISITIDPEYDRPKVLKEYSKLFNAGPDWIFLTGNENDIYQVANSFDAFFGSKMNHQPLTLLKNPNDEFWYRIEGLATGTDLAKEIKNRLLNLK